MRVAISGLEVPLEDLDNALQVTISAGVASVDPRKNVSATGLIEAADRGLYEAKEQGRNRIVAVGEISR